MQERMVKVMHIVKAYLFQAQEAQARVYNRSARLRQFQLWDCVLVLIPTVESKFLAKWQGLYEMVEKLSKVNYEVHQPGRRKTHSSRGEIGNLWKLIAWEQVPKPSPDWASHLPKVQAIVDAQRKEGFTINPTSKVLRLCSREMQKLSRKSTKVKAIQKWPQSLYKMQESNLTMDTEFFLLGFQSCQNSRIVIFCLLLMIYCGTICGNLLLISLVSTSKNLHTPMYFFISLLSISDILLITDIVPYTLHILLNNGETITFIECLTQFCIFGGIETSECFLLTVMSYDRYVAICNPLHYTIIMTSRDCVKLATLSWLVGFLLAFIDTITVSTMKFCGPNIIDHFFCDLVPLIELACSDTKIIQIEVYIMSFPILVIPITIIIISYANIISTIFRVQSSSRRKAFSTCSSHLIVVSIFYLTILSVYVFPTVVQTLNINKLLSLLYTVFTPFINPIIYSLRNKEIKMSLKEIIKKYLTRGCYVI
ncbi:olfactory receptor 5G9-like [Phyllobates terribilis]|uniref:olfactory receptor 5G9-like n=1 Tax=Phyllobates terribilis TaxID=111132 RepID=UPI003CCB27FF